MHCYDNIPNILLQFLPLDKYTLGLLGGNWKEAVIDSNDKLPLRLTVVIRIISSSINTRLHLQLFYTFQYCLEGKISRVCSRRNENLSIFHYFLQTARWDRLIECIPDNDAVTRHKTEHLKTG